MKDDELRSFIESDFGVSLPLFHDRQLAVPMDRNPPSSLTHCGLLTWAVHACPTSFRPETEYIQFSCPQCPLQRFIEGSPTRAPGRG